jgi:hypothetical protein
MGREKEENEKEKERKKKIFPKFLVIKLMLS